MDSATQPERAASCDGERPTSRGVVCECPATGPLWYRDLTGQLIGDTTSTAWERQTTKPCQPLRKQSSPLDASVPWSRRSRGLRHSRGLCDTIRRVQQGRVSCESTSLVYGLGIGQVPVFSGRLQPTILERPSSRGGRRAYVLEAIGKDMVQSSSSFAPKHTGSLLFSSEVS